MCLNTRLGYMPMTKMSHNCHVLIRLGLMCMCVTQGSVALFYNWLKIGGAPHTWVTNVIEDYALPVNFVGLSTEDRRFIYPQKEVSLVLVSMVNTCCVVHAVLCVLCCAGCAV